MTFIPQLYPLMFGCKDGCKPLHGYPVIDFPQNAVMSLACFLWISLAGYFPCRLALKPDNCENWKISFTTRTKFGGFLSKTQPIWQIVTSTFPNKVFLHDKASNMFLHVG